MMKSITKLTLSVAMFLQPSVLWAQDAVTRASSTDQTANSNSSSASTGVETRGSPQNGASVKDGADKTASANKGAQAQQFLAGALMMTMAAQKWGECSSQNYSACAMAAIFTGMGILSFQQGGEHGKAAGSAGMTSFQANGLGDDPYGYGGIDLKDPNNPLSKDPNIKALGSNMKTIQSGGLYDPKTGKITTPDGKSYKASDFASQGAMAAAGIPGGAIAGALSAYDQIQKKSAAKVEKLKLGALTAAGGFDEGGGGGGAGVVPDTSMDGSSVAGAGGLGSGEKVGLMRDPSSLAGMQKNYNGEPIGVAADSIFLMMTRRYKVKESQESFFTDSDLALQK